MRLFFLLPFALLSCKTNSDQKKVDVNSLIEEPKRQSFVHIDSLNNFKIPYPKNWQIVDATSSKTVFKVANVDSMISISVNIQNTEPRIDNLPLSDKALTEKSDVTKLAYSSMGVKIIKLKVFNYDLGTRKVIATIWYEAVKVSKDNNVVNVSNDFEFNFKNKRYSISLKGPLKNLDENTSMYYIENFIESFRILDESTVVTKSTSGEQRDEDGLLLNKDLIFKTYGEWNGEGTAKKLNDLKFDKSDFTIDFRKDATGTMTIVILTDEKKDEVFLFSFDIYPWGIVNNKNNIDVLYFSITNGKLIKSTLTDKKVEKNIANKFINNIYNTKGLKARVSINNGIMELSDLNSSGFYPLILQKR